MKKLLLIILIISILISPASFATLTFVDVTSSGDACIFDINGNTVVVEKRDSVRAYGWMIFVHKTYPVHIESGQEDVCKFKASRMSNWRLTRGKNPSYWVKKTKKQESPLKINRDYTPRKDVILMTREEFDAIKDK